MGLIFLTGAVVLSLEVLSSRIMTPYFGVSLYIWAGILSITLTFLAVGYYAGGEVSKRIDAARLRFVFLAMPVLGAAAVWGACLVYPFVFPWLAQNHLVLGSFIASGLLLAVPLVCLSAMNPMLISLRAGSERTGDGGAGVVLFVSTAGSVAGVLVTAFMLIPGFANFEALLRLGAALCLFAVVAGFRTAGFSGRDRRNLIIGAAVVAALCGALIAAQDRFLGQLSRLDVDPLDVAVLDEYRSVFGNIKVARVRPAAGGNPGVKIYLQDGIVQNQATPDNISVSMYTYVLDRLARAFVPEAKTGLVLGLGAGYVPRDMKARGMNVSIVDINPHAVSAARDHFGFDPAGYDMAITDARTYVHACGGRFDVAVVDLFQGDATPDYLMTAEFFADLRRCLKPGGAVVMNAFFDDENDAPNRRLLATIRSAFGEVMRFRTADLNAFVVGLTGAAPDTVDYDMSGVPEPLWEAVVKTLDSGRVVRPETLLGYPTVRDRQNHFSTLMAASRMAHRQFLAGHIPARLLVN